MNNHDFEQQIRKLQPAPLPPELRARLREEPPAELPRSRRHGVRWAMAATVVVAAVLLILVSPHQQPNEVVAEDDDHFSVVQQEATLLGTRTLETREYDGQLWELVEQQWRDETVAVCSATPVRVRSTVIRPEAVWVPVKFQ